MSARALSTITDITMTGMLLHSQTTIATAMMRHSAKSADIISEAYGPRRPRRRWDGKKKRRRKPSLEAAIRKEQREHPWLTKKQAARIVRDHRRR